MVFVVNKKVNVLTNSPNIQGLLTQSNNGADDLIRYDMSTVEEVDKFSQLIASTQQVKKQLVNIGTRKNKMVDK